MEASSLRETRQILIVSVHARNGCATRNSSIPNPDRRRDVLTMPHKTPVLFYSFSTRVKF